MKKEAFLGTKPKRQDFMTSMIEDMVLLRTHAKRITTTSNDLKLAIRLYGYERDIIGHWKPVGPRG